MGEEQGMKRVLGIGPACWQTGIWVLGGLAVGLVGAVVIVLLVAAGCVMVTVGMVKLLALLVLAL